MKMKRRITIAALAAGLIALATACSSNGGFGSSSSGSAAAS
jgi:hypothetical protein